MSIPPPVLAVTAKVLTETYSWSTVAQQFLAAGAPDFDPGLGNKATKAMAWLRHANSEMGDDALGMLGHLLFRFMEEDVPEQRFFASEQNREQREVMRAELRAVLSRAHLAYVSGGTLMREGVSIPTKQLADLIKARNDPAVEAEFVTLAARVAEHPRDALSAAANTVEAVLGEMVAGLGLTPPSNRTLNTLWATVKPAINADPAAMPDDDLRKIVGAMAAMVDGLQGLRDDKSRAHAMRPDLARSYRIEPRHARLAVNAALTFAVFLLDAWQALEDRKRGQAATG